MSFSETWSYSDSQNWKSKYPAAAGTQQSPINIDTAKTTDCNLLCQIAMKYSVSKCYARVVNKTPIITFDSGSFIKFTKTKEILALKQMTIHTPSLHTFNGTVYDMEVVLYHKLTGTLNPSDPNYVPGGTAISILFQKGADYGKQNNFFNAFINQLPVERGEKEQDIPVGDSWGPEMIIPELKSYYFYPGSLPFPPCEENWKWLVFEEVQGLSSNIIDTLGIAFNNNIRPPMRLSGRVPAYNSNVVMKTDNELEKRVEAERQKLTSANNKGTNSLSANNISNTDGELRDETQKASILLAEKAKTQAWYKERKLYIKGIIIAICLLLVIFGALRMVKWIINEDILNLIMIRQALGDAKQEKMNTTSKANNLTSSGPVKQGNTSVNQGPAKGGQNITTSNNSNMNNL
jgi:carbonic anhydrase